MYFCTHWEIHLQQVRQSLSVPSCCNISDKKGVPERVSSVQIISKLYVLHSHQTLRFSRQDSGDSQVVRRCAPGKEIYKERVKQMRTNPSKICLTFENTPHWVDVVAAATIVGWFALRSSSYISLTQGPSYDKRGWWRIPFQETVWDNKQEGSMQERDCSSIKIL